MTAPTQPPTREAITMPDPIPPSKAIRLEVQVTPQPNVTLYNGADQTEFSIVHKVTGERMLFGKRLGERTFDDILMILTCDEDNALFWILVVDVASGAMWQNGYLVEHAEAAFRVFTSALPAEVRATLMVDSPSN